MSSYLVGKVMVTKPRFPVLFPQYPWFGEGDFIYLRTSCLFTQVVSTDLGVAIGAKGDCGSFLFPFNKLSQSNCL